MMYVPLTGSDEHGQKFNAAEAQGITPLEYTTNIVNDFKALWEKCIFPMTILFGLPMNVMKRLFKRYLQSL